ncbi:MAG: ATP-binding protein [Tepidiformaceae bacterium]
MAVVTNEPTGPVDHVSVEQAINKAFSPHAPINQAALFRGRREQIREVVDTVTAEGLHAVIYGERGVGKTSLANIINDFLGGVVSVSKVICGQGDSFDGVIRRAMGTIQLTMPRSALGLTSASETSSFNLLSRFPDVGEVSPDAAATLLSQVPLLLVIVIDEFDRLTTGQPGAFADFLKALSDRGAMTTVVLIGVAEDVNALLGSHASVVRNLRQIHLPRMSDHELGDVIDNGLASIGFSLESDAPRKRIVSVSQGFPHYTHLLAQYAARAAHDDGRTVLRDVDVVAGMRQAVERGDQSHRDLYYRATTGTRKKHLWREVVAGCALAESDERGYFSIRNAQEKVSEVTRRVTSQQAISYHLGKLTHEDRGPLLERTGPERRYRYRFVNSLMRPFILMKAMNDGLISP